MLTHYMRMHLLPLFYTLTGLFSDDSRFAYPDTGCFILLIRYLMRPDMLRGVLSSLSDYWYFYFLLFPHFLDSRYIGLTTCFIPLFICDYVWTLYILLVILIYQSRFY